MDRETPFKDEGQENFLAPDFDSVVYDGLDLNKYLFIHSSIDDAGLDPYEFRIFCHLRRRAKERTAWPGMRSIAEVTGISLGKVSMSVSSLQNKGFITVRKRLGHLHQSNVYIISAPCEHRVLDMNAIPDRVHEENTRVHDTNATEGTPIEGTPISYNHLSPKDDHRAMTKKMGADEKMKEEEEPELPGTEDLADPSKKKPKGLPSLAMIQSEVARLGLPDSDAQFMLSTWLMNGFRTKAGPIRDWRAAIQVYFQSNWFPSQKKRYQRPTTQEEIAERIRRIRDGR